MEMARNEKARAYQREYAKGYNKDNYKQVTIRLNLQTDADVIEFMDELKDKAISKNQFVVDAIREKANK